MNICIYYASHIWMRLILEGGVYCKFINLGEISIRGWLLIEGRFYMRCLFSQFKASFCANIQLSLILFYYLILQFLDFLETSHIPQQYATMKRLKSQYDTLSRMEGLNEVSVGLAEFQFDLELQREYK